MALDQSYNCRVTSQFWNSVYLIYILQKYAWTWLVPVHAQRKCNTSTDFRTNMSTPDCRKPTSCLNMSVQTVLDQKICFHAVTAALTNIICAFFLHNKRSCSCYLVFFCSWKYSQNFCTVVTEVPISPAYNVQNSGWTSSPLPFPPMNENAIKTQN